MNSIPAHQKIEQHIPKFSKGDDVLCIGANTYSGTVLNIGRRSPNWKIYVYQVRIDFDGSIGQFFENELELVSRCTDEESRAYD